MDKNAIFIVAAAGSFQWIFQHIILITAPYLSVRGMWKWREGAFFIAKTLVLDPSFIAIFMLSP